MTDTFWQDKADEYLRLAAACEAEHPKLAARYRALAAAYSAAVAGKLPVVVEKPPRRAAGT